VRRVAWLALVLAAPAVAHADADPAALEAADANLESTWRRRGTSFTFAAGAGLSLGFGVRDATGNGGSFALRLAHAATARTLVTIEVSGVTLFHKVEATMASGEENRNDDANFLVGGLHYLNRALWLRAAVGVGVYTGRGVDVDGGNVGDVTLVGPAGAIGAGLELLRVKHFTLELELLLLGMANREGVLSSNGLMLGFQFE
jgi:hypothetical protein